MAEMTGKKSKKELIECQKFLTDAQRIVHLGSWEWNIKDNTEKWSDETFRIFGYKPGEIEPLYDHFVEALHPEDRSKVLEAVKKALDGDEPYKVEFRLICHGGEEKTVVGQGEVDRDDEKNPVRMVGTILDISGQKRTEEELKRSKKDLQRLAGRLISNQEEELRRLARELHDDLTQRLAVLSIDLGNLELNFKEELPEEAINQISKIKEKTIKISEDVHHLSRDLHPSILEDLGLVRAVKSECNDFSSRTGIAVVFTPKNIPLSISNKIALSIYRIIQEGLVNIARHANTKNSYVFLEGLDNSIQLSIRDTGQGFDQGQIKDEAALGLSSMRERARLVNGEFSISSETGGGTNVEVDIPLKKGKR